MNDSYSDLLIKATQDCLDRLSRLSTHAQSVEQAGRINEVFLAASSELHRIIEEGRDVSSSKN